jgi:hypothetical protein
MYFIKNNDKFFYAVSTDETFPYKMTNKSHDIFLQFIERFVHTI